MNQNIKIPLKKIEIDMLPAKWWPFYLGLLMAFSMGCITVAK